MTRATKSNRVAEAGFSYIDVMVALVIFLVGILGYLSALSAGIFQSRGQQQQIAARHIAASSIESIMAAKETDANRLGWITIGNVGSNPDPVTSAPRGIFVTGFQPVYASAGPDEVVGTADDTGGVIEGFTRRIVITDVCDPDRPSAICPVPGVWATRMRQVEITVRYFGPRTMLEEKVFTVLTDYTVAD